MPEVFGHKEAPASFWALMDGLAEKVSLKGWKRYRGDFGNDVEIDSYYTEWKGVESTLSLCTFFHFLADRVDVVMYHISMWLNSEQHRRLIGNDVVVAIFTDSEVPLSLNVFNGLGTVPQIFAVIKPHRSPSFNTLSFSSHLFF